MTPFHTGVSLAAPSRRDDRIDFLRGLALLTIFIDHVPKNAFEPFTLHAYAFSDAAEVFFFISGYVAALVYGRTMERKGFVAAAKRVWRRAGVVYGAQFALLAVVLSLVWVLLAATGDQTFRWMFRVQWVYEAPLAYALPALTLHYQPGYLDILPSYVLLLVAFPLVLKGLGRSLWLVLVPSAALWLAVQVFGITLWTTNGEGWFFNPFAWQFIFVLGAVFGHPAQKQRMAFLDSPLLFWAASGLVALIAVVQVSYFLSGPLPVVPNLRPANLPIDKTTLSPLRLVSFLALAVVVRRVLPPVGTLQRYWPALAVIRCGRASLQVFSFGVALSSLTAVSFILGGGNLLLQSLLCVAGVGAQFAYAAHREHMQEDRAAVRAPVLAPAVFRTARLQETERPWEREG
ncbi:MAG: OpgC domain-containing protein [Alphaproteobacteria bacterium]|nr:OpgC domain-containing protein [Alphaproteobacteria bacterium]MDE2493645.1 OpgC domain-containing protein [Alphaproteobacteria bacterium]